MADEQEQTKAILPFLKVGVVEWLNSFVLQYSQALNSFDHRFCECSGLTSCRTPSPRCNTRHLSCRTLLSCRMPDKRRPLLTARWVAEIVFELAGGLLLSYVRGGHGE